MSLLCDGISLGNDLIGGGGEVRSRRLSSISPSPVPVNLEVATAEVQKYV